MKTTLGTIYSAKASLDALLSFAEDKLAARVSYKIAKLAKKLYGEFDIIEKQRVDLIKKYGTEDEATKNFSVDPNSDAMKDFAEEFNALLIEEVELDTKPVEIPEDAKIAPRILFDMIDFLTVKE
jgi:hypothetical protein